MRTIITYMRGRCFEFAKAKFLVLFMLLSLIQFDLFSQSVSYTVSYSANVPNNPGSLNTETDFLTSGWTSIGNTVGPQSSNVWSFNVNIPFAFNFFGTPVTAFKVNQGGVLTFSTSAVAVPGANTSLPSASLPDMSIAMMWDNFTSTPPTSSSSQVYYKVFGTAPNRQLWVKYSSFEIGSPSLISMYFAAVLEESTNKVYVIDMLGDSGTGTTTVGLQYNSTFAIQDGSSPNIPHGAKFLVISDNDVWTFTPFSFPACSAPPIPGTSTATLISGICPNVQIELNLSGNSIGSGQTYQWQSSANIAGPYVNVGSSQNVAPLSISSNSTLYYRCQVTCSGNSQFSTPVLNTLAPALPAGTYTINSALPTGGTNFQTFNAFSSAISCGIGGPIVVNVVPGSGPYFEQVEFFAVLGTSPTKTITINGNNNTLTYGATLSTAPGTLILNGTDNMIINNLVVNGTGSTYALVCHLWNQADRNSFNNCTFNASANTSSLNVVPFSISGSATDPTFSGASGSNNIMSGCTIVGGFYNTVIAGNFANNSFGNQVINCTIRDHDVYGIYCSYQTGVIIRGNTLERPTRTNLNPTYYGIYITSGCDKALVEKNRIRNTWATAPTSTGTQYSISCNIDASAGNENRFYDNLISDCNFAGTLYGLDMSGADYWKAYHNTISFDQTSSTSTNATYGIYSTGTLGVEALNNNISI